MYVYIWCKYSLKHNVIFLHYYHDNKGEKIEKEYVQKKTTITVLSNKDRPSIVSLFSIKKYFLHIQII